MYDTRLQYLFEKYFNKTASAEEREELAELMGMEANREQIMRLFEAAWEKYEGEGIILPMEKSAEILDRILSVSAPSNSEDEHAVSDVPVDEHAVSDVPVEERGAKIRRMPFWVRVAAAVVVLFGVTYIFWSRVMTKPASRGVPIVKAHSSDVGPGSFKASLTLADGRRITLDSAGPGQLALQGNTKVISKNGGLLYKEDAATPGPVMYNTLTTGKGQTYSFSLPDGSKVWLNSASSIRFPVAFPEEERRIEISGEVYIQVAKDAGKSFVAVSGGLEVDALGTAFNVMAYKDEEHICATLVEGAVRLSGAGGQTVLRPGQQVKLDSAGNLSAPENVDVDEVVAWKEGNFQFEDADIRSILRQFARWYDVEVIYEGPVKDRKFFGVVSRNSTLVNVLEMLKASDIRFRIEGKKLYVTSE